MDFKKLINIQQKLKAPKGQYNNFGKYAYRSCEDILEALKPILAEEQCALILKDDIILIGERYYVRAVATLRDENGEIIAENSAYAREEAEKKGMDGSQITGASSSYARKYALNGLFGIDDNKDSDATNETPKETKKETKAKPKEEKPKMIASEDCLTIVDLASKTGTDMSTMLAYYKVKSVKELSAVQAEHCIKSLNKKLV